MVKGETEIDGKQFRKMQILFKFYSKKKINKAGKLFKIYEQK